MNLVDIDDIVNNHLEKIEKLLYESSDIIKIMDLIVKEMGELEYEVKKLVASIPGRVFIAFKVTGAIEIIKMVQELYLNEVNEKLEILNQDFTIYLDCLAEKRIINNLDKVLLLNLTKLIFDITYGNTYSVNMLERIEEYQEKKYYK